MRRIAKCAQFVILAAALILLSACNLPQNTPPAATEPQPSDTPFTLATPPAATVTRPAVTIITATPGPPAATAPPATAPAAATEAVTPAGAYPVTPDGVVQAFVDAYPDDTNGLLQYLSASLKSSLPQGGPGALLNVPGDVNGFVILSGSALPQPPQAEIQAAFQLGAQQALRTFDLVQENGRWVINSIQ